MQRRTRFNVSKWILFAGAICLVLSAIGNLFFYIPEVPAEVLLTTFIYKYIPSVLGNLLTVIGLAFVMTINKSYLKAFIFSSITLTVSAILMFPMLAPFLSILVIGTINIVGTIVSFLTILTYYFAFDGISWYFDRLGDRTRSMLGQKLMWIFSIFIGCGCAVSWIPTFVSQIYESEAATRIIGIAENACFLAGYITYLIYLIRSLKNDF